MLVSSSFAGEVIPDGTGTYGVELDVLFTFEPDSLDRWESVFQTASGRLWRASSGEVYLKKVNFIVCPFEVEGGETSGSADIVIRQGDKISYSPGTLSGSRPGGVVFYDKGASVANDARVMAHELSHYIFEVFDEYKKPDAPVNLEVVYPYSSLPVTDPANIRAFFNNLAEEGVISVFDFRDDEARRLKDFVDSRRLGGLFSNDLTDPVAITRLDFRQFCSQPLDVNDPETDACIMDSGILFGDGFATTGNYYRLLCDDKNHSSGVVTLNNQENLLTWSKNAQAHATGKSCATIAKDVWIKNYQGFLKLDGTLVNGNGPETKFEEKTNCDETVVLLLDKSGSMSGARIANLKRAAMGLIDSLDDDTKLGIVWFDSQPRAAVGIQELKDSRVLAKQAIAGVEAGGGTKIGFGLGVAYQQMVLLRDPDKERPEEIIFLITDGESSDDPTSAVNTIKNDGVKIHPVSIGSDANLSFLQEVATLTGGTFYFSAEDEDIARVVTQGATENLEGYSLVSEATIDPLSNTIDVELDSFVNNVLIQIELRDFDTTALSEADFSLTGPGGQSANATIRFTSLDADNALVTFELAQPAEGTYTVNLPDASLRPSSVAQSLLLVQSDSLRMFACISPNEIIDYPAPAIIKAGVESQNGSVQNLPVFAEVRRPDGSVETLQLFDDGNPSRGDELAGDGVYSASFARYNADGTYSVDLLADNSSNQAVLGFGMHAAATDEKVGAFKRRKVLSFEVRNYTVPVSNTLTLSRSSVQLPEQLFSSRLLPSGAVVLANFHATTGAGQGVLVEELELTLSSELIELANFEEFHIYIDGDKDGLIDFVGEHSRPLSRTRPIVQDGKVSLRDFLTLPADSDVDILVVGLYKATISVDQDQPAPLEAALPLGGLTIAGLLVALSRRRRSLVLAAVLTATSLLALGCGSDAENFVFGNPGSSTVEQTVASQIGQVRTQLSLDTLSAVGVIDGLPVSVQLPADPLIDGSRVTVEAQIPTP